MLSVIRPTEVKLMYYFDVITHLFVLAIALFLSYILCFESSL